VQSYHHYYWKGYKAEADHHCDVEVGLLKGLEAVGNTA